jgi:hypothetical protein
LLDMGLNSDANRSLRLFTERLLHYDGVIQSHFGDITGKVTYIVEEHAEQVCPIPSASCRKLLHIRPSGSKRSHQN